MKKIIPIIDGKVSVQVKGVPVTDLLDALGLDREDFTRRFLASLNQEQLRKVHQSANEMGFIDDE